MIKANMHSYCFVDKKTQQILLKVIDRLPPEYLLNNASTLQDLREFAACKHHWVAIKWGLEGYFSGKGITEHIKQKYKEKFGYFPYSDKEWNVATNYFFLIIDSYIKLYGVLSFGWEEIKKDLIPPKNSPGEVLTAYLEELAINSFEGRNEPFRPRKIREVLTICPKATSDCSTEQDKQKFLKSLNSALKGVTKKNSSMSDFVYLALEVTSQSKNHTIKRYYKDYCKTIGLKHNEIKALAHPRLKWKNKNC